MADIKLVDDPTADVRSFKTIVTAPAGQFEVPMLARPREKVQKYHWARVGDSGCAG
jgi:hypothetical protein